jgi:hypothetical protein
VRVFVLVGLTTLLGCGAAATFTCDDALDCGEASDGVCEPEGWCSFPDAGCDSGRRFGRWSGGGRADRCVPAEVAEGVGSSTGGMAADVPGSTSVTPAQREPSTGSAEGSEDEGSSTGVPTDPLAPVLWLRFDEPAFDGVVLDATGQHHGSCALGACPLPGPGRVGGAGHFDGLDDIVRITDHPDFHTDAAFTIAVWLSIEPSTASFRGVVGKPLGDRSYYDSWELGINNAGHVKVGIADTIDSSIDAVAPELFPIDTWVHVAGRWDGVSLAIYIDGQLRAEQPVALIDLTATDVVVGASWDVGGSSNFTTGTLDELQLWSRALDDAEIAALALR